MTQIPSNKIRKAFILFVFVLLPFIVITAAKFYFSMKVYPKTAGLQGLLAEKKFDILFIGSSLTRQSYDIGLIEREHHLKAYALAYNGMSPLMAKKNLTYAIESGDVHLRTVVVEAYPYKLYAQPYLIEDARLFNSFPSKLKFEVLKEMYDSDLDLGQIFNLVVCADNESIVSAPMTYKLIEKLSYNGGYVNKNVPGLAAFATDKELYETSNIYRQQFEAYTDIIALCKRHNIRVIFVEPFVPYYVQNGTNYNSAKTLLRNLFAASGAPFIENRSVAMNNHDVSLFADFIHLSTKGRELWSREILRTIGSQEEKN
jgi:hypothetical protein